MSEKKLIAEIIAVGPGGVVDGNEIDGCIVPVAGDGKAHKVEAVLG